MRLNVPAPSSGFRGGGGGGPGGDRGEDGWSREA